MTPPRCACARAFDACTHGAALLARRTRGGPRAAPPAAGAVLAGTSSEMKSVLLLLLLPRAASDALALTGMPHDLLEPGAVAIGPNGASLLQQPAAWLLLSRDDERAASLAGLKAAAAAHLHIVPEVLLLADTNGQTVRSIEQAVESGMVYGRHSCLDSSTMCEQWMWPANRPGERITIAAGVSPGSSCEPGDGGSACSSLAAGAMAPDSGAKSFTLETLSTSPRVFRVESFLSQSELAQINAMVRSTHL